MGLPSECFQEAPCRLAVLVTQPRDVHVDGGRVDDFPVSADHHPVGGVRAGIRSHQVILLNPRYQKPLTPLFEADAHTTGRRDSSRTYSDVVGACRPSKHVPCEGFVI